MTRLRWGPRLLILAWLVVGTAAFAQAANDTGTVSVSATASSVVEFSSGGAGLLIGNLGGGIAPVVPKGSPLAGMSVGLGEVGPANLNAFVVATIPLRVRSNVSYTLSMSATPFVNADPLAIQPTDVGFGVTTLSRADFGVIGSGADTFAAGVSGDPSTAPDAIPATVRWDYATSQSLSNYATAKTILNGSRIMRAVPRTLLGGLTLNAIFSVKPQFFSPGSFSTTVTYTVVTP